jgi:hypothetical protein
MGKDQQMSRHNTGLEQLDDSQLYIKAMKAFAKEDEALKNLMHEVLARLDQKQYEIIELEEIINLMGVEFTTLQ